MSDKKYLYKIVPDIPKIGKTIYTNRHYDRKRIKRQKELSVFFELIYNYYFDKIVPISAILSRISPYTIPIKTNYIIENDFIAHLSRKAEKNKFQWLNEE